jgi:hypothetical protein
MNPQQLAAVSDCTPGFGSWRPLAKRQLVNRIRSCHVVGERALIRRAAIIRARTGVRELQRGVDVVNGATPVGTRTYYLNPDNTVAIVDEWD